MSAYYLWITVPTPRVEPQLLAQLVGHGYVVSVANSDSKTTHTDNGLCSIIALKAEKDVKAKGDNRAPIIVLEEVIGMFKELGARLLSIVVSEVPGGDAAWKVGGVPKETVEKVPDDAPVSPEPGSHRYDPY